MIGKSLRDDYSILEQAAQSQKTAKEAAHQVQVDSSLVLVEAPYVKALPAKEYTLVLDLDETLLHYYEKSEYEGELRMRPGADNFLKEMSQHFEIVIFTAAMQDYADWALEHFAH